MCHQITELYSECRCLYYQHDIDRCASGGLPGHGVYKRTILVGHACHNHSQSTAISATSKPKLQLRPRPGASRPDAGPCHPTISKDCTAGEGARRAEMLASLGRRLRVGQRVGAGPQQSSTERTTKKISAKEIMGYPPTPEGRPVNDSGSQKQLPRPSRAVKPHRVALKKRRWDKLAFQKHEPVWKRAAPP